MTARRASRYRRALAPSRIDAHERHAPHHRRAAPRRPDELIPPALPHLLRGGRGAAFDAMPMNTLTDHTTDLDFPTRQEGRLAPAPPRRRGRGQPRHDALHWRSSSTASSRHIWRGRLVDLRGDASTISRGERARVGADAGRWRSVVLDLSDELGAECVAGVWLSRGEVWARAAARDRATLAAAQAWLRERLPVSSRPRTSEVPVRFWTRGRGEGSVDLARPRGARLAVDPRTTTRARSASSSTR